MDTSYLEKNRELWNARVKSHLDSGFYDLRSFREGKSSLNAPELRLLGNINGKSLLHLQCHFGQDSLSLARMGATVTGVDLSDEAVTSAQKLATELNLPARFICCNVYDTRKVLNEQFDLVFSSYGTIGWLPDLKPWAAVVASSLKPGGRFVFAEFHPVIWMLDNDLEFFQYSYFKSDPIIEIEQGTYADKSADISLESVSWNHGLAEVIGALQQEDLVLRHFEELNFSPYNIFPGMTETAPGQWQIEKLKGVLPLMYTLEMQAPA